MQPLLSMASLLIERYFFPNRVMMTHADWQTVWHNGLSLHLTNHASFSSAFCSTTFSVALCSVA